MPGPLSSLPTAILRADPWPTQLIDNFDGTEAMAAHYPDLNRAASYVPYSIKRGTWNTLSGGEARYSATTFGCAIVDCGLSDIEISCRLKCTGAAAHAYGFIFRSNSDGTNRWQVNMWENHLELNCYTGLTTLHSHYVVTPAPTITIGSYYTVTVLAIGNHVRLYLDEVFCQYTGSDEYQTDYATNTYVGLGTYQANAAFRWDSLTVKPIDTKTLRRFSVIGDSISDARNEWLGLTSVQYHDGLGYLYGLHAAGGARVELNMETYCTDAAADDADIIGILMGTNDAVGYDPETKYAHCLTDHLGITNLRARIFALGYLETTYRTAAQRTDFNGHIEAACTTAKAAGVNVTYLNTDGWIDYAPDEWLALTAYALDEFVRATGLGAKSYAYRCTVAGTSAAGEPVWPVVVGGVVVDGTVTWTCEAMTTSFDTTDGLHPDAGGNAKIATQTLARLP